jgi:hypothetical protein
MNELNAGMTMELQPRYIQMIYSPRRGTVMSDNSSLDAAMEMMERYEASRTETHYFDLQENEKLLVQTASHIYGSYVAAGLVTPDTKDEYINRAIKDAITIASRIEDIITEKAEQPD